MFEGHYEAKICLIKSFQSSCLHLWKTVLGVFLALNWPMESKKCVFQKSNFMTRNVINRLVSNSYSSYKLKIYQRTGKQ